MTWHINMPALLQAERLAVIGSPDFLPALRILPLDDLGELLLQMPDANRPGLAARLPSMASAEIQRHYTGSDGWPLMRQTLGFLRLLDCASARYTGSGLAGKTVLDFGFGWGRMLRLLPWYTDPGRIYGCDPEQRPLDMCAEHRVWGTLKKSAFFPETLPFDGKMLFDVVFAFSVFTHTSPRALRSALGAIRRQIHPNGILVATIRPMEFWRNLGGGEHPQMNVDHMEEAHRRGFAHLPLNLPPVDGEVPYGNTSMTLDYLASHDGWRIVGYDHLLDDPWQVPVFLRPA